MILLLLDGFGTPAEHDIHTPGAISIEVQVSDPGSDWPVSGPIKPSESLNYVRCQAWLLRRPAPCADDATLARDYWPKLGQTSNSLYVAWYACGQYWNSPSHAINTGFNVEYLGASRTLTIHCYTAVPWIPPPDLPGVEATVGSVPLLVVPTKALRSGNLTVVQDDRLEHLMGDQSTESPVATATIS
jgi:hypothetical protein